MMKKAITHIATVSFLVAGFVVQQYEQGTFAQISEGIGRQAEKLKPITECFSVKLDKETGDTITTRYPCN